MSFWKGIKDLVTGDCMFDRTSEFKYQMHEANNKVYNFINNLSECDWDKSREVLSESRKAENRVNNRTSLLDIFD